MSDHKSEDTAIGAVDTAGQPADVSNLPLPEQPPMLDDEDGDEDGDGDGPDDKTDEQTPVEDTSTDDLSVQGGD